MTAAIVRVFLEGFGLALVLGVAALAGWIGRLLRRLGELEGRLIRLEHLDMEHRNRLAKAERILGHIQDYLEETAADCACEAVRS